MHQSRAWPLRISRFARRTTEKREAARSLFQGLALNCRGLGQCGGLFLSKKRKLKRKYRSSSNVAGFSISIVIV